MRKREYRKFVPGLRSGRASPSDPTALELPRAFDLGTRRRSPTGSLKPCPLWILPVLGLLAAACQSVETNGATREEKSTALANHLSEWQPDTLVNQFAAPRTMQLFVGLTLGPGTNQITADSTGLATLLTTDGYALTATHVLKDGPVSVLQLEFPRPGQLSLTEAGTVFTPLGKPDHPVHVPNRHLKTSPVRIVHRFPGSDLTLVHLPITATAAFDPVTRPPDPDHTVFSYGSSLSGSSSAGKVIRTRQRSQTWKVTTSIPLRKGDSGGPVMNSSGRLVAIISGGQTRPFSRELTATIANGISRTTLESLIAQDRQQ